MKKSILFLMLSFGSISLWSQVSSSRAEAPAIRMSNWERLTVDYEVKNNPTPDQAMVQLIDLNVHEFERQQEVDVELIDVNSGYTIILYSINRTLLNKKNGIYFTTNPSNNTNSHE